jgi:hypothetical protein
MVFSWMINRDSKIPGTVVRASTIPEELGRISYLLTDKTGGASLISTAPQVHVHPPLQTLVFLLCKTQLYI